MGYMVISALYKRCSNNILLYILYIVLECPHLILLEGTGASDSGPVILARLRGSLGEEVLDRKDRFGVCKRKHRFVNQSNLSLYF